MKLSIGLALGGGGARGAAHIGVLQVLHEAGIRFNRISGTSVGSIVGAMYAYKNDPDWIEQQFKEFMETPDFIAMGTARVLEDRNPHSAIGQMAKYIRDRFVLIMSKQKSFIIKRSRLEKAIRFLVPAKSFSDLLIPLEVNVTDLQKGESVLIDSGDLIDALVQSSTIPGYVQPTQRGNQILVDGGIINPVPVKGLKNKVDYIIALSITKKKLPEFENRNMYEILTRSDQITSNYLAKARLEHADYVIHPDVGGFHWSRFDQFDRLLTNGREAAELNLSELINDLRIKSSFFYQWKQKLGFTK